MLGPRRGEHKKQQVEDLALKTQILLNCSISNSVTWPNPHHSQNSVFSVKQDLPSGGRSHPGG